MDDILLHPEYKLFHTSADNIDGMFEMMHRAKESIDIETFYFMPDAIGRRILDLLIKKAMEGVTVRLLVDAMGSFSISQSLYMEAFRHAGVHIRFFNSFIPFSKHQKAIWFFRNHRRSFLVDNRELFVSSICIGEPTKNWIETGILLKRSQAVIQAQRVFNQTWHKCLHKTFKIGTSTKISTDSFSYITQAPLQSQKYIYKMLVDRIRSSEKSIILVAPYIIPDRRLMRALRHAKRRKVDVTVIAPKKTDLSWVDLGRNTIVTRLLVSGISVYFNEKMIHSKLAVFDEETAFIGSMNLDNVSLRYNYECTVVVDDQACVTELMHSINKDMLADAKKLHLGEWQKRSFWTKVAEKLVWPIRKIL